MAEDKVEAREVSWRQLLPWTELFRGFSVALDLNKLLLAAAGIFVMAFGWWLLAVLFTSSYDANPPSWPGQQWDGDWAKFKKARDSWNLMHGLAGVGSGDQRSGVLDLAQSEKEYEAFKKLDTIALSAGRDVELPSAAAQAVTEFLGTQPAGPGAGADAANAARATAAAKLRLYTELLGKPKPSGYLSRWPWFEDRGPNPFLLATGQLGKPWETGRFWEWFSTQQVPVLIEPLVKLLTPIINLFNPSADGWIRFYLLLVTGWFLATWAIFGGAITRIAAVQITRGERIGMGEAVRFTLKRFLSYLTAPLFPLVVVVGLIVIMALFGLFAMIPIFGDVVISGLLWWLMLVLGLVMAIFLVGLVGWPLMSATISAEGTDSWEAVSRSYSYVYQRPWHYIWYGLVNLSYGAIVIFFVGFMGSLTVSLAKFGVTRGDWFGRDPSFLFTYAPTSFHWRDLLLKGATIEGENVVQNGEINQAAYDKFVGKTPVPGKSLEWYNKVGAFLVAIWLYLFFLLILGFGYSFFWSANTITYLLMRKSVDSAEMDEVYLEEDDQDMPYSGPLTAPAQPAPAPKQGGTTLPMVEAPPSPPAQPSGGLSQTLELPGSEPGKTEKPPEG